MQNTNAGLQIHQFVTLWYLHKAQKGVHELGGGGRGGITISFVCYYL